MEYTKIYDRVFWGSRMMSHEIQWTHIVNCSSEIENTKSATAEILFIPFLDDDDSNPLLYLDEVKQFIDNALSDPKSMVYIHCHAGINRSAALAVAYRCDRTGESANEVLKITNMNNRNFKKKLITKYN